VEEEDKGTSAAGRPGRLGTGRTFLPPEPAGPEPELGERPAPPPPPQYAPPAGAGGPQAPPLGAPPPPGQAQQPPSPGGWHPPQGQAGWQQQPPQQPPPGTWQQPGPWGYAPPAPDNGSAVAGFVLSLVSVGLLFISAGLSSLISVGCSIAGIVYGRKGVKRVDAGETPKNRGIAQAGFWIGWAGLGLAVLATIVWIVIVVLIVTDDEFRRDFENEFDNSDSIRAAAVTATVLARLVA
jgi:hypothetical protein